MKVLIYGSKGWIGGQFISFLDTKISFLKKQLKPCFFEYVCGVERMENTLSLRQEIFKEQPTHIISFIGRTNGIHEGIQYTTIDYLEQKGRIFENVRDNLFSPISLALICNELNIHYTYLGTGCIFNYDEEHPYGKEINGFNETSKPNFFGSSYSIVKGFTDQLMHQLQKNVLNLRIRMPINSENFYRNFISKITNYEKICSIPNSMTVLPDFFPIIFDLLLKRESGTLNLTNPGLISHNEILEMYKEIVDNDFTWKNFTIEEQDKILDGKRSNNFLDTNKLKELYPEIKNIKDSVRLILQKYRK